MSSRRYRAFISYNHRDEQWASWLHRALESYRIPRKLVGTVTASGAIPRRLSPIFRDRDELSSASDLSAQVKEALANSDTLIVVCSPGAVSSRWVNEEIREFRRLGRGARIFALIVDGDPQAMGESGCFPAALLESEADTPVEPLAADARKWADGRLLAKLKLLAGILGLPLDSLRRRDHQRRQRIWILSTISLVALALVVTLAVTSRIAAEKRRAFAEDLVGFKLSDLSGRLTLAPGTEPLDRVSQWEQAELPAFETPDARAAIRRAQDLRSSGLEHRRRGDLDAAMEDFRHSWLVLALRIRQAPGERDLLFELGQAEFWVGQVFKDLGEIERAEYSMVVYADITRRLLRAEPDHADWVLEMAYALTNLGFLEVERRGSDPERALQFMQLALEFNQIALVLDPANEAYRVELEQSHANVADAQMNLCDLGSALHSRMESTRLAQDFHDGDPQNERKKRLLAFALGGLAGVQESIGLNGQVRDNLQLSIRLLEELLAERPDDAHYALVKAERESRLLAHWLKVGDIAAAASALPRTQAAWDQIFQQGQQLEARQLVSHADFLLVREQIEAETGNPEGAAVVLADAITRYQSIIEDAPELAAARSGLAAAAFRHWQRTGVTLGPEVMGKLPSVERFDPYRSGCQDIGLAVRMALLQGDLPSAESYTDYLLGKGYYEPGFIALCRAQGLCEG